MRWKLYQKTTKKNTSERSFLGTFDSVRKALDYLKVQKSYMENLAEDEGACVEM